MISCRWLRDFILNQVIDIGFVWLIHVCFFFFLKIECGDLHFMFSLCDQFAQSVVAIKSLWTGNPGH